MNIFDRLIEAVKFYDVSVEVKEDELTIVSRANDNRISVYEEAYYNKELTIRYVAYTVCFSTQHRHFDYLDDVEEYVLAILQDNVLPIEFYKEDARCFGGEISIEEYHSLTPVMLTEKYGYCIDYLSQYEYEIHSWSGNYDIERKRVSDLSNSSKRQ
ncbi:MAG: hypothetical protein IJ275_00370 [Ruminococcus sp.]|nr:hypothetical protein [Ruminococcus sp.]